MRIVFLAPSLEVGGAERQLVLLANGLADRGHDISIALFRKTGALVTDVSSSVKIVDLAKKGRWDLFGFLWRLRCFIGVHKPDAVYSFLGVPNLSSFAMRLLGTGVPIIWGVRASDMDMSQYGLLARLCTKVETLLSPFADAIIMNSEAGKNHAASTGWSTGKASVVPNGLDVDAFRPQREIGVQVRDEWGIQPEDILVGLVGRLDPMKDHGTFLQAAKRAAEANPRLRFVCIGDGPLRESLVSETARLGLGDRVIWAGVRSDMPEVYNAIDICCLSSITEGFPNVLGEAMATGTPCVSTDVGDAALILGDTGLTVAQKNPQALAEALLGMAGRIDAGDVPDTRSRICELFSLQRMVERTERIIEGVTL